MQNKNIEISSSKNNLSNLIQDYNYEAIVDIVTNAEKGNNPESKKIIQKLITQIGTDTSARLLWDKKILKLIKIKNCIKNKKIKIK